MNKFTIFAASQYLCTDTTDEIIAEVQALRLANPDEPAINIATPIETLEYETAASLLSLIDSLAKSAEQLCVKPPFYFLLSNQLCEIMLNDSFEQVVETIETDNPSYELFVYNHTQADLAELLTLAAEHGDYTFLSPTEYETLLNI